MRREQWNADLRSLRIVVDLRINETPQTGAVRKTKLPFHRLVGAVSNCAYSVRLETAPTGPDNKFTPIYRGDRNRGVTVSIYFWCLP